MKIRELKENEPLKVIEVTERISSSWCNSFINKTDNEVLAEKDERVKIKTNIITDGIIEKQTEETSQGINEFYIGKSKYKHTIDTLKTKDIYIKNHSFVIVYLTAAELSTKGSFRGWYDDIKDVSIYLKNEKDKKALTEAKEIIKGIIVHNINCYYISHDYASFLGMLKAIFSPLEKLSKFESEFEPEEISKNIYTLKRIK